MKQYAVYMKNHDYRTEFYMRVNYERCVMQKKS
jgi:hypothetical protein